MAALKESTRVLQEELRKKSELLASLVVEVDRMKSEIVQNSRSNTRQTFKEFTSDDSSGNEFPVIDENDQDWDPDLSDIDEAEKNWEVKDEVEVVEKASRKKRVRSKKKDVPNKSKTSDDEPWTPSMLEGEEEEPKVKPVKRRKRTGIALLKKPAKPKKTKRPKKPKKPKERVKRVRFKTHSCPQCHYKAKSAYHIKRHMVKHTGDKPFPCPHCTFAASRKFHLTRHIQARHEDQRRFKCDQCSYAAKTNDALKNHIVTHSVIKSFLCEWCEHSTKTIGSLRSHCKTCHGLFICGKERVGSIKVESVSSAKVKSVSSVDSNVDSVKVIAEDTANTIKGSISDIITAVNEGGSSDVVDNNVILEDPSSSSGSAKVHSVSSSKVDIDSSDFYRCTYVGTDKESLEKHMSLHQSTGSIRCEHCVESFGTMDEIKEHSTVAHDITLPLPALPTARRRRIRGPRKSSQSTSQNNLDQFNPRSSCAFIDLPLQYTLDYLTSSHGNDSSSSYGNNNATSHSSRIVNSFNNPLLKATMLQGHHLPSSTTNDYYGIHDNLDSIVPSIAISNMFRKSAPAPHVDSSPKMKAYPGLFQ